MYSKNPNIPSWRLFNLLINLFFIANTKIDVNITIVDIESMAKSLYASFSFKLSISKEFKMRIVPTISIEVTINMIKDGIIYKFLLMSLL
jgi:hypothetical protein